MLTEGEAAVIATRVTSILHAVHQAGYVHRDVKPEHILLARQGDGRLKVTLLDFGVCAAETAPHDERERERGRVFGTPAYASPEQACGNPDVDGRADLFGLGVTMFEALAGHLPFHGDTITNLLRKIIREDAPRVSIAVPNVSPAMEGLVGKLLARDPSARFPTARAVARALATVLEDRMLEERRLAATLVFVDTENDKPTLEAELQVA
jgi:serine/threonine-protein kinase